MKKKSEPQLGTEKSGTFFFLGTCGIKDILYQFAGAPALTLCKSRNYNVLCLLFIFYKTNWILYFVT